MESQSLTLTAPGTTQVVEIEKGCDCVRPDLRSSVWPTNKAICLSCGAVYKRVSGNRFRSIGRTVSTGTRHTIRQQFEALIAEAGGW